MPSKEMKKKCEQLQKFVGKQPKIKVDGFKNWSSTQKRNEILACSPKSLEEVQAVVKGCHQLGIRIRCAGATHSWTPVFSDEEQLVMYTKDLKRHDGPQIELIQNPDDDAEKHVTVMTNVTTGDMMDFQISHGVCLPCNVVLQSVTYGGVVATSCHGTGQNCKTVSDYITAMRIVDSDGVLRSYSIKEDGIDFMLAIQCNLGLFGVIYDITFKIDNMVIVTTDNKFELVEKVFYDKEYAKDMFKNNWAIELFWFPFNGMKRGEIAEAFFEQQVDCGEWDPKQDEVWLRLVNKPEKVGDVKPRKAYDIEGTRSWMEHMGLKLIDDVIVKNPGLTPNFGKTQLSSLKGQNEGDPIVQQLPHAVHFRDNIDKAPVLDMEWAIDFDEGAENFCKATQYVIERVKALAAEGKFPLNMPMEMRLMSNSDAYMSPALAGNPKCGGSGYTLCIEIVSLVNTPGWKEFTTDIGKFWASLPGARPHWNKQWAYIEGLDQHVKDQYKDQIPKFLDQLKKSNADPDGIFFNDHWESLIYPDGHPGWKALKAKQPDKTNEPNKQKESKTCKIL